MNGDTTEKINVRGVRFDNVDESEALFRALTFGETRQARVIYTPNAEIVQMCIEDKAIENIINSADMIIPDGAGVVLASKLLHRPLKGKVAGIELAEAIVRESAKSGKRIFFLGSKPERDGEPSIADLAGQKLGEKYEGFRPCGTHDGYFKEEQSAEIIEQINAADPDFVFVCLGAPRQEKWIYDHRSQLRAGCLIGLGGSLDVFAGAVKRAPRFFIRTRLEWFYRLLKQPSRIGRMMKLPKFIISPVFCRKDKA